MPLADERIAMTNLVVLAGGKKVGLETDLVAETERAPMIAMLERWLGAVRAGHIATVGIAAETHDGASQWEWSGAIPSSSMVAAADILHVQARNAMLELAEDVDESPLP